MTKLVFISDTHGMHRELKVPDGDILVHCGDLSGAPINSVFEISDFKNWFQGLDYKHKIFIAGNHDAPLDRYKLKTESFSNSIQGDVHYLMNAGIELEGIRFWGSPYTPTFFNWYFMADRGPEIAEIWKMIPEDTDVLITHGPPFGKLDFTTYGNEYVGCVDLIERVEIVSPKIHAFGHIHENYGMMDYGDTTFINASSVNSRYKIVNEPIVVEL